jgi:hypothetical protein
MKIGFTGTRQPLEFYQRKKVAKVLLKLAETMTYAITGACQGVDSFVAHWVAENTDAQQIIIFPSKRDLIDETLYALPNAVFIEMPKLGDEHQNGAAAYRRRNQEIVNLSERLIAFWIGNPRSGTVMTMNMGRRAGILDEKDIHRI